MNRQVRVPIRVKHSADGSEQEMRDEKKAIVEPAPPIVEREPVVERRPVAEAAAAQTGEASARPARQEDKVEAQQEELEAWRDRALRLQAEMENFRKRQRRLAQDQIRADRARLLRNFLMLADDLERALRADSDEESLREGMKVTYRGLKQLLKQEGAERIKAQGELFDPEWHDAVATVPHRAADADRDTVVEVTQEGYRLNGKLLRPARVIVAA